MCQFQNFLTNDVPLFRRQRPEPVANRLATRCRMEERKGQNRLSFVHAGHSSIDKQCPARMIWLHTSRLKIMRELPGTGPARIGLHAGYGTRKNKETPHPASFSRFRILQIMKP